MGKSSLTREKADQAGRVVADLRARDVVRPASHIEAPANPQSVLGNLGTQAVLRRDLQTSDQVPGQSNGAPPGPRAAFALATSGPSVPVPFREEMQAAFGRDFGSVAAHPGDSRAIAGLAALGARGAAHGREVVFNTSRPSREQVAHELTHVVQNPSTRSDDHVEGPESAAETEARAVARRVTTGGPAGHIPTRNGGIHLDGPDFPSPNPTPNVPSPLNQASAVAGQASNALNGPTAGVGENFYATGWRKPLLVASIAKIAKAGASFYEVAKTLGEQSQEKKDHPLLVAAGAIKSFGEGLVALAKLIESWTYKDFEQIEEWRRSSNPQNLEKASKMLEVADILINSLRTIEEIKTLNDRKADLAKKPSLEAVEAWADSVGSTFDVAAKIPIPWMPEPMKGFYKGLLTAPKAYISAFKKIMHNRYNKIDDEADQPLIGYHQQTRGGAYWNGELTPVYISAWFQPKLSDGRSLPDFMVSHLKAFGTSLYDMKKADGALMLIGAIASEIVKFEDSATKTSWVNYLGQST